MSSTPRLFADNTCILVEANTSNELKYSLNYELAKIDDCIVANKLTLNAAKSSATIIKPKLHSLPVKMNFSCAAGSIKVVSSAKYLSVFINDKLNFHEHIKNLEKKVSRSVGILSKLKNYLPTHALFLLYYTFVHSHLLYELIVWGNAYPTYLSKLITLQNKALHIVTKSGWYQNVLPLYQKFNLMNLQNLHKFETAKFIHNQINQRVFPNFNNYFTLAKFSHSRQTRTTASLNLIIPLYKTIRTQQSIKYSGAKIWNSIPNNTKDLSFRKFSKESKEILLNSLC